MSIESESEWIGLMIEPLMEAVFSTFSAHRYLHFLLTRIWAKTIILLRRMEHRSSETASFTETPILRTTPPLDETVSSIFNEVIDTPGKIATQMP